MVAWLEVCLTAKLAEACSAPSPACPCSSSCPRTAQDQAKLHCSGKQPLLKVCLSISSACPSCCLTEGDIRRLPRKQKMPLLLCRLMQNLVLKMNGHLCMQWHGGGRRFQFTRLELHRRSFPAVSGSWDTAAPGMHEGCSEISPQPAVWFTPHELLAQVPARRPPVLTPRGVSRPPGWVWGAARGLFGTTVHNNKHSWVKPALH